MFGFIHVISNMQAYKCCGKYYSVNQGIKCSTFLSAHYVKYADIFVRKSETFLRIIFRKLENTHNLQKM